MNKILFISIIFLASSCVSSKKFNQLTFDFQECENNVQTLKAQNQTLEVQITTKGRSSQTT